MKLSEEIKKEIKKASISSDTKTVGSVQEVKDGIVFADGLDTAGIGEIVTFESSGVQGMVQNLEPNEVGIIVLGDYQQIVEGAKIIASGKGLTIKVDENIRGRVVDALGNPIDDAGEISHGKEAKEMAYERIAPGVIERKNVDRPMLTGLKAIDALIPVGRGQRELIIGDRQTGKTAVAIDTIINQKSDPDGPMTCIYVAIGQKRSKIAQIKAKLEEQGAMEYTVIVNADAAIPSALQYLAPYAGCAIGEYFAEKGEDALVIYDDLSKHAWAYRQISLLFRRPPGREAYPGDVFYLHSRLLERALQYSDDKGGGSLTALPIIETLAGDVSAYIPTNVISITDGQIFLDGDLFYAGQRPAVNVGISVSRVGGDAQLKPMKQVAGTLKLELAQFRELAAFAQFGSELDSQTQKKIDRGERMNRLLNQKQYDPMPVEEQVVEIYAAGNGYLDEVPLTDLAVWEEGFRTHIKSNGKAVLSKIRSGEKLENDLEKNLKKLIESYTFA